MNTTLLNTTCQQCGEARRVFEILTTGADGGEEVWVYCHKCDIETFHPMDATILGKPTRYSPNTGA